MLMLTCATRFATRAPLLLALLLMLWAEDSWALTIITPPPNYKQVVAIAPEDLFLNSQNITGTTDGTTASLTNICDPDDETSDCTAAFIAAIGDPAVGGNWVPGDPIFSMLTMRGSVTDQGTFFDVDIDQGELRTLARAARDSLDDPFTPDPSKAATIVFSTRRSLLMPKGGTGALLYADTRLGDTVSFQFGDPVIQANVVNRHLALQIFFSDISPPQDGSTLQDFTGRVAQYRLYAGPGVVPEPASLGMWASVVGFAGLARVVRRRRSRSATAD